MAKRFTATEIWEEDWFLEMPNEYKLFWYYMLSTCDHAGLFKVNLRSFCNLLGVQISDTKALDYFNLGKSRIRVISKSVWFIEDFFSFQYGQIFNFNNNVHESIDKMYKKHSINTLQLRGLKEVKERTPRGQRGDTDTPKDKDKDKDIQSTTVEKQLPTKLAPEMVKIFKESYPAYPEDEQADYSACLQIAYKIAKQKKWAKDSVLNGKMKETLESWKKIVEFSTTDRWYAKRSISDFDKEFQRIVQSIVHGNKQQKTQEEIISSAPPLSRLGQ